MSLRFRRRVRLMPGLHLNLSKSGLSLSAGVPGATVNVGPRGRSSTVGLPGTGLFFTQRSSGGSRSAVGGQTGQRGRSLQQNTPSPQVAEILVDPATGGITLLDEVGVPLTPAMTRAAKRDDERLIRETLHRFTEAFNAERAACVDAHLQTSSPSAPMPPESVAFSEPAPVAPPPIRITIWDRLFLRASRRRVAAAAALARHERQVAEWRERKNNHHARNVALLELFHAAEAGDTRAATERIEAALSTIVWPRETDVEIDVGDDVATLDLRLSLAAQEAMPDRIASVPDHQLKVSFRKIPATQIRRDHDRYIHAAVFRAIGECFAALGALDTVTAMAIFVDRDPATGQTRENARLKVTVDRKKWADVDFARLADLDPAAALARFG